MSNPITSNPNNSVRPKTHNKSSPWFPKARLPSRSERRFIEVFDFEKNWHLIEPHLPMAERSLNIGLTEYLKHGARVSEEDGLDPTPWRATYNPEHGPWSYSYKLQTWNKKVVLKLENAVETGVLYWDRPKQGDSQAVVEEKMATYSKLAQFFLPKPNTYEWYQAFGVCHWLVPWQLVLGRRVFPNLNWEPVMGFHHSFAAGFEGGKMRVIFDILNFNILSADQLIAWVAKKADPCPGRGKWLCHYWTAEKILRAAEVPQLN
jgi:hypothetical protein